MKWLLCALFISATLGADSVRHIYIDNRSGYQEFADTMVRELHRAPVDIVDDAKTADLTLVLSLDRTASRTFATVSAISDGRIVWSNTHRWTRIENAPKKLAKDCLAHFWPAK